jgi:hypothetical protein
MTFRHIVTSKPHLKSLFNAPKSNASFRRRAASCGATQLPGDRTEGYLGMGTADASQAQI